MDEGEVRKIVTFIHFINRVFASFSGFFTMQIVKINMYDMEGVGV